MARKFQEMCTRRGMSEADARGYSVMSTPDQVVSQVQQYLDAGLDGMMFNMHDAQDLEPVALAGETLAKLK